MNQCAYGPNDPGTRRHSLSPSPVATSRKPKPAKLLHTIEKTSLALQSETSRHVCSRCNTGNSIETAPPLTQWDWRHGQCAENVTGLSVEGAATLPNSNFPFRFNKLPIYQATRCSDKSFTGCPSIHCSRELRRNPSALFQREQHPRSPPGKHLAFPTLAGLVGLYVIVRWNFHQLWCNARIPWWRNTF